MSSPETLPDNKGWNLLREQYQERGLVLALGAGVSTGCRLPSWPDLLKRMASACFGEGSGRKLAEELMDRGYSLPAIAGVLEIQARRNHNVGLVYLIRSTLYEEFPIRGVADTRQKREELIEFVHSNNPTLRAVASLCARRRGQEYLPNPKIAGIVNFNVDSILRNYTRAKYREWLLRTIVDAADNRHRDQIPVYHMHGFVAYDKGTQAADDATQECVFTEQQYFDFFNRPHSLFNYTFLHLLREYHVLFIGMSMLDDNVRRLLHYSTSERRRVLRSEGKSSKNPENTGLRHFAIMKYSGSDRIDGLIDLSLRRLGTRAIWLDDYDEIPERLGRIYESKDQHWGDVY